MPRKKTVKNKGVRGGIIPLCPNSFQVRCIYYLSNSAASSSDSPTMENAEGNDLAVASENGVQYNLTTIKFKIDEYVVDYRTDPFSNMRIC